MSIQIKYIINLKKNLTRMTTSIKAKMNKYRFYTVTPHI